MSSRALDDAVAEEQRLRALSQIRQFGDPALRTPAARVTAFDEALADEIDRMVSIMVGAVGVGLAAPQIGALRRVIVVKPSEEEGALALVNPSITWSSDETDVAVEGCLSLGEVTVEVERPVAIRLTAQDAGGEEHELEYEGLLARVVQHEVDHLDGTLILDRTDPEQRREALRELRASSR